MRRSQNKIGTTYRIFFDVERNFLAEYHNPDSPDMVGECLTSLHPFHIG